VARATIYDIDARDGVLKRWPSTETARARNRSAARANVLLRSNGRLPRKPCAFDSRLRCQDNAMTMTISKANIQSLAPSARSSYRTGFDQSGPVLAAFGISDNALRMAHFMAQVLHESGGLTAQFENLNYSAQRLPVVWPTRFEPGGPLDPAQYAHNPEKLADAVYGGRMGNTAPGDGYLYRGRGLIQITGKSEYSAITEILRKKFPTTAPDLVATPDAAISEDWGVAVAASVWEQKGCNPLADQDAIKTITFRINGGYAGLALREEWLLKTKAIWH
jgi:putative chitinase